MRSAALFAILLLAAGGPALLALTASPAAAGTTGSLAGTVVDYRGKPIADVSVSIQSPAFVAQRKTDAHGFYVFVDVAPGQFRLSFYKPNYSPYVSDIQVAADSQTVCNARLDEPLRTITTLIDYFGPWFTLGFGRTADQYSVRASSPTVSGPARDAATALRGIPGITAPLLAPDRVVH